MAVTAAVSLSSFPQSSIGRFNAVSIVMRTLIAESPPFPLFRTLFSPHKSGGCQRGNQFVTCTETCRPKLWGCDGD
jgi:hypothetical protein